ncbi:MAG: hypothetical protein CFE46_02375 [Burkholderiales bacterium PBB6]|nr:MAG: hypothetical protein CFE46_02375 [Burkholderiales bacterium PBB6]
MGEEQRPMIRMWTQGKAQLAARLSAALLSLRALCLLALLMMGAAGAAHEGVIHVPCIKLDI